MLHPYRAYGLTIASELVLPEVLAAEPSDGAFDVTITLGRIPSDGLEGGQQISPFAWVRDDVFWLHVPKVCRFLLTDASHIVVDPEPRIDEASIRVFLLGSVLGALLFQRGHLLLHGNAIEVDGRCMVCLGHSGAGKSTLAAALVGRGHRVLADDVVPVNAEGAAVPGLPRLKLWQDSADRLDVRTDGLTRIRPQLQKYNVPVTDLFCDTPLPIRWIYLLENDNQDSIRIEPVSGMNRFQPLRANTYRRQFMEGLSLRPEHLRQCGELAGRVHMARVARPRQGFDVEGLVDSLLADIRKAG